VWGSKFTSKNATIQGDSADIAPTLNAKLWNSVRGGGRELPPIEPKPLFESIRTFENNLNLRPKNLFREF
jgi:hypothetical protein